MKFKIHTSPGDLMDRMSILVVKMNLTNDMEVRKQTFREFVVVSHSYWEGLQATPQELGWLEEAWEDLFIINTNLWHLENENRIETRVETTQKIQQLNWQRSDVKLKLNQRLGSVTREMKDYSGQ